MDVFVDRLRNFGVPEVGVSLTLGMDVSEKNETQSHAQKEEQNVRDDALSRAVGVHYFGEKTSKRNEKKRRGGSRKNVREVRRVRQKEAARRSARKRRRHGKKKTLARAAPWPAKRANDRHGARLLRYFVQKNRRRGEPPERAAHLKSPRHDDAVDKAVKRTAEKQREGFDAAVVFVVILVGVLATSVGGVAAPGVKETFKEHEKDDDRQGALPHPFRIRSRREGFRQQMSKRHAQEQPAGKRHEGVAETSAPPERKPRCGGEREKARQEVGREDFKHGQSSEKKTRSLTKEGERNSLYAVWH